MVSVRFVQSGQRLYCVFFCWFFHYYIIGGTARCTKCFRSKNNDLTFVSEVLKHLRPSMSISCPHLNTHTHSILAVVWKTVRKAVKNGGAYWDRYFDLPDRKSQFNSLCTKAVLFGPIRTEYSLADNGSGRYEMDEQTSRTLLQALRKATFNGAAQIMFTSASVVYGRRRSRLSGWNGSISIATWEHWTMCTIISATEWLQSGGMGAYWIEHVLW